MKKSKSFTYRPYRLPQNYDPYRGHSPEPFWGFADIMTLERGPAFLTPSEAKELIGEINASLSVEVESGVYREFPDA
jgi:hypothetical protein